MNFLVLFSYNIKYFQEKRGIKIYIFESDLFFYTRNLWNERFKQVFE